MRLESGWSFRRLNGAAAPDPWTEVDLPHSPFVADLDGLHHWFGECEYRRLITLPPPPPGGFWALYIGAAMHTTRVLVDDCEIGRHEGGYLPFEVNLSAAIPDAVSRRLTLRLDNRDNPDIPPGKAFDELDFCWYGGLYRSAELRLYPAVHITDPVAAGVVAGGGVFVRTLRSDAAQATLAVRTHVGNHGPDRADLRVRLELAWAGSVVATATVPFPPLARGSTASVEAELDVNDPRHWAPESPERYDLHVSVITAAGVLLDQRHERVGIRRIGFSRTEGFVVNGRRRRLRGTNRHQEFPRVGYAASRAAQFRDARRIKEAGFDYVRLSHYPQSPDFLEACDELGIVVMNCIPGWQYLGGEKFRAACFAMAREMIRRDRNHPCVVLWELSLNETVMDDAFMAQLHAIGHEEYPGDQMYTCGWIDRYDVFLRSRQHGELHTWRNGDKALVIAEYGDWEFYAATEGFDQKTGAGLYAAAGNGRKFRGDGERGLRQQAWNHMVALNDTLASPAVLDGQWSMFDYARGYDPVRAACGVMDIFRLPKFSYYFYRSQRDPGEDGAGWSGGPMVFIASHWLPTSELRLPVFSNCDTVELRLNGAVLERVASRSPADTKNLPHPPFVFAVPHFAPGVLIATGYLAGRACCTHRVATPGAVAAMTLQLDDFAITPAPGESDVLLVHAELRDAEGTLCVTAQAEVAFAVVGDARVIGPADVIAEAGVASAVVHVPGHSTGFLLRAQARRDSELFAERKFPARGTPEDGGRAGNPLAIA